MKTPMIALLLASALAAPALAQTDETPRYDPPARFPLGFSLSGGIVSDGGGFVNEIGTHLTITPRLWLRTGRVLAVTLEGMVLKESSDVGGRWRVWPAVMLNFESPGPFFGIGLIAPKYGAVSTSVRLKANFGFKVGPALLTAFVITRFQAAFVHSLFGADVGIRI